MKIIFLALIGLGTISTHWAAGRFFTRPSGQAEPGARWTMLFATICGSIQVVDVVRGEVVSVTRWAVAVALYLVGAVFFWSAISAHGSRPPSLAYSRDLPETFVMHGPYSLVRHPVYTAYLCTWFAPYLVTGKLTTLAAALFMFPFFERAARLEEQKFAHSEFREAYARYMMRTGRFVPNPWKIFRSRLRKAPEEAAPKSADGAKARAAE